MKGVSPLYVIFTCHAKMPNAIMPAMKYKRAEADSTASEILEALLQKRHNAGS
jgi:hypothetical protein